MWSGQTGQPIGTFGHSTREQMANVLGRKSSVFRNSQYRWPSAAFDVKPLNKLDYLPVVFDEWTEIVLSGQFFRDLSSPRRHLSQETIRVFQVFLILQGCVHHNSSYLGTGWFRSQFA